MDGRSVNVRVGGQSYKVVSSASEEEVQRLAATVSAKVEELTPVGKSVAPQTMLLAAIALAHELEEERAKRTMLEERAREMFSHVLNQLDEALDCASDQ